MDPLERAVAKALAEKNKAANGVVSHNANDNNGSDAQQSRATRENPSDNGSISGNSKDSGKPSIVPVNLSALESTNEIQLEHIDRPVLIEHHADENSMAKAKLVGHLTSGKGANIYSMLRTQVLQKMQRNDCRSLGIIGAHTGAGKSSVAANLALSIARNKDRAVVLVDLDLRAPSLHRFFGITPEYQFSGYLDGQHSIEQVCISTQYEGLHLCLSENFHANAGELMDSKNARDLVSDLRRLAPDPIVIFDLPPILGVPDVHSFLPNFDAALIIAEYARTTKAELNETLRLLGNKPLVGYVVNNGYLSSDTSYGYGYGTQTNGDD